MKKYIKYILFLSLGILYNCDDAIDIDQPGRLLPENAFLSVDDLEQGLVSVYGRYDVRREIELASNYTDEVAEGIGSGGQGRNTGFIFNLNAGTGLAQSFWGNGYREINAINRLLAGAENVIPADAAEIDQKNNILGQLYALRAFSNFQMLSYFSTDYTDDSALSHILVDFVPIGITTQLLRNTNGEIYQHIEDDLALATSLVEEQANPVFVSQDFITALRARMGAYRQDYAAAEANALDILNRYPLASRAEYQLLFQDDSNTEVIFKLDRVFNGPFDNQNNWAGNVYAFTNATIGGGPFAEIGRSLFNLFDPLDIRYTVNVEPSSIVAPSYTTEPNYRLNDVLLVGKYRGIPQQSLLNDLKVFRASEMVLILAEVEADRNNFNGATNSTAAYIRQLREARFGAVQPLPTYANSTEAFAAILNERRIEFAFEGHRWKDLKRMGVRADQGAVRDPLDASTFNMTPTLPPTDYRFTLPIPLSELDANPGIRAQQNPGYGN